MLVSEIISQAIPGTAYGAAIGFTSGVALTAALERFADKGPYLDADIGIIPYAFSKAMAPFVIILGGIAGGLLGAIAGFVNSVALKIL